MYFRKYLAVAAIGSAALAAQFGTATAAEQSCPSITTTGIATEEGKGLFTANVTGTDADITFNWSISAGGIESGQGTAVITVGDLDGGTVTATVDIGGLPPGCSTSSSETISFD